MTTTVSEVFEAFQKANGRAIQSLGSGGLDQDAVFALRELGVPLLCCNAVLELDEEQARAFQKYAKPVPKED